MKKIRVNFILVLVIAALLALLLVQSILTIQLYDRKTTEFSKRFSTTLDRIALRHEKAEDIRRYMLLADNDFSGQYKDVLKQEFQDLLSTKESISIRDTAIFENGEMENYLIIKGKTYDSISGLTAEQRVLARDVRQLRDLFHENNKTQFNQDSLKFAIQLDQRVIQQIFKKARFVNQMMIEAFRNNVYENPSQRFDIGFLDSVLRNELMQDDLPEGYEFFVVDEFNKPIAFENTPEHYIISLDTTKSHKTLLFPSNPIDDNLFLYLSFPEQHSFLLMELWAPITVNFLLVIIIIAALVFMFRTILTQKKLSELKSDFISNMTHEFKTPISTIALACEAMNDSDMVGKQTVTIQPYLKMIDDENNRLGSLVERILQSATLDRGEIQLKEENVLLNEMINDIVENAKFRLKGTGGSIQLNIPNELIRISADKMHLSNVISNLFDNAIKYSNGAPEITVELSKEGGIVQLIIRDKGIGIAKEHLNKIFDKLYRVPTGNVHNVKGFGLGLSYVKAISDFHKWNIQVKSRLGKGSEFILVIKE